MVFNIAAALNPLHFAEVSLCFFVWNVDLYHQCVMDHWYIVIIPHQIVIYLGTLSIEKQLVAELVVN